MAYVPERGDIIWLDFDPQAGREQGGHRPALVLSPQSYNAKVGLIICCPITSKVKGYAYEFALPDELPVKGVVLSDHVKCLDWHVRNATFIVKCPEITLKHVLAKLNTLLR